jgi:phosphohistidine phosphatase
MERRLIIMRHAQSDRWSPGGDHGRRLSANGREEASRIARRLVGKAWVPAHAVVSDARRAQETWEILSETFNSDIPMQSLSTLYLAGLDALVGTLCSLPNDCASALALGHNPGWSHAASHLTGETIRFGAAQAALLTGAGPSWATALETNGGWHLEAWLKP